MMGYPKLFSQIPAPIRHSDKDNAIPLFSSTAKIAILEKKFIGLSGLSVSSTKNKSYAQADGETVIAKPGSAGAGLYECPKQKAPGKAKRGKEMEKYSDCAGAMLGWAGGREISGIRKADSGQRGGDAEEKIKH